MRRSLLVLNLLALLILAGCMSSPKPKHQSIVKVDVTDNLAYGIPSSGDKVLDREGFATGYIFEKKQPAWVSYRITDVEATNRVVRRSNNFVRDPLVEPYSADPSDYRGTRFDRGHIAPAADMGWSAKAMTNSFYMSNMSPQVAMFNRGIWRELETWVRDTAVKEKKLFVYSGPIFSTNSIPETIGKSKVEVPVAYYKVILVEEEPKKAIGFILPNEPSNVSLTNFACTVDEVERITGIDFYEALPRDEQDKLESSVRLDQWEFPRRRRR